MEQWSILSNVVNYIQYNRCPKNFHKLDIRAVSRKRYKRKSSIEKEEETHMLILDFGDTLEKLKKEYLDVYERILSEILSTTRFDENSDLSTMYLGRVDKTKTSNLRLQTSFCQFQTWLLPGLRKMLTSGIFQHKVVSQCW